MARKIKRSTAIRLAKQAAKAREYLQKIFLTLKSLDFVILTEEDYKSEANGELIYELPISIKIDKYSIYEEYVILEIHQGKTKLGGLYDNFEKIAEGTLEELSDAAVLALAELVEEYEYPNV